MTKVEMMAKLKRNKGVGVEITTATGKMKMKFCKIYWKPILDSVVTLVDQQRKLEKGLKN